MADVYLGLGSNLGDRRGYLRAAIDTIATLPQTVIHTESPIYETLPMGPQDQSPYCNMVARIETSLAPQTLIEHLQAIESHLGRLAPEHRQHWGPREIDIDVLLYDDQEVNEPGLTVPHPGMQDRWFVLKPLADIAPTLHHPLLNRSIKTLLADLETLATQGGSHG